MTLLVDAGALYVHANRADPLYAAMVATIDAERGPLVTSEAAAQEAAYLIGDRLGIDAELAFLDDLASGAFEVACLDLRHLRAVQPLFGSHFTVLPADADG